MVKKIPGKTLTAINRKVGFRFVTKFGEKGIINLGKVVPVLGAFVGGGMDVASTRLIGYNAYKIFIKGEIPKAKEMEEELSKEDVIEVEFEDIDSKTIEEAINSVEVNEEV